MKRLVSIYFLTLAGGLLAGCSNGDKPAATVSAPKTPAIMPPFRYHKLIEVSPGQDYDVVSWGRGSTKTGSFAILHSDSAAAKFVTTTGDLTGTIVDVFNTDMDLDGNPEIIIQAKGIDTNNYTNVYAFEFTNGHAEKLDFPRLTKQQRQGYRGEDNFYVQDGKLMREFPLFDANAKANGQKRQLEYGMSDNSLTVKDLNKNPNAGSSSTQPAIKAAVAKPKADRNTGAKKHKKKHRRRQSEE
ncbi:MAG TPA: hypothetical protein VFE53_00680 [Mucilaginibacter sp.]|jgi:hypothetical protein|nr:hypothetical protein [Mucilaginibacter sp.]